MHSVQAGAALEENVQQLYHNGLSVEDYSTAVNYSSQLNAQQAVQQSYAASGSAGPAAQHSSSHTSSHSSSHSSTHTNSHSGTEHVNSNSAHALLTAATSSQLHTQRTQQSAASHAPAGQPPVSAYYYSHLQSHHPSHSSQTAPNTNQLHTSRQASGQQTAASLLHQHQQANYHSSHVQATTSNSQLNQLNQLVASADQQLQSMTAGGSSCPMPSASGDQTSTVVSNSTTGSSTMGSSTAMGSSTTMGSAHPTMCKSGNNSNNSIINLIINNNGQTTDASGSSVMVNGNSDSSKAAKMKQPTNGDPTNSLPNSPGQLNKQSGSPPNTGQHPVNQIPISPNGEQQLLNTGKQPYPSAASVLIEGLTELDLVNSVNAGPHAHLSHPLHQQALVGEQSSVSPLIVVNCNNSLSSNNSNFTDDTAVTYQPHQNSHNSITLTGNLTNTCQIFFFHY